MTFLTFFTNAQETTYTSDFTIAFGSCNRVDLPNPFWEGIASKDPDVFIWGGDVIYADTDNMKKMEAMYSKQKNNDAYKSFAAHTEILGTWDDHDYGINDGGAEYSKKQSSQKLFLDFLNVPKDSEIRNKEGVYMSKDYQLGDKLIKIIVLDTRYFRTELTDDRKSGKRYIPNENGEGTVLGAEQWLWLTEQLNQQSDYCIVMSSIQFLSAEHGFETWGNFPSEIERFENLVKNANAQRVVLLSGDRHISEFSRKIIEGVDYPLIDFTSSGLTHSYTSYSGEPNHYRVGDVISVPSYGLLTINLDNDVINFKIMGVNNQILGELSQDY
ncbi:alkaline phosphatase D family protein [Leeuwenhoekiella sp. NPDC079379]|uniref:alkaline phosphatase D family protein n=1 Tax=Leeuwenhoekiella sp. NPDC079379 TaxID=3364122 RepID=UPI0037C67DEB